MEKLTFSRIGCVLKIQHDRSGVGHCWKDCTTDDSWAVGDMDSVVAEWDDQGYMECEVQIDDRKYRVVEC
jgi:hypothetical protein